MFTNSHERLALCAYWICVIYVSVRRFYNISKQSKTERILLRKYYHLVAVLIFSPAVIFQVMYVFLNLIPITTLRDYFDQYVLSFVACFLELGIWCSACSFLNTGDDSCKNHLISSCSSSLPSFLSFSSICYVKFAHFSHKIMPSGLGSISSWTYCTSIHERLH